MFRHTLGRPIRGKSTSRPFPTDAPAFDFIRQRWSKDDLDKLKLEQEAEAEYHAKQAAMERSSCPDPFPGFLG